MFTEGEIIYFDPFYFKNGNTAKEKYCLILKTVGSKSIVASLPTRTDSIPVAHENETGCVELPEANLNCFVIAAGNPVTKDGDSFPFKTLLYGHEVEAYDLELMQEVYVIEGTDYVRWGQMLPKMFSEILDCFKNSKSVKRGVKKLL